MEPSIDIHYAGVVVAQAELLREHSGHDVESREEGSLFLFLREPMPVGTEIGVGSSLRRARVEKVVESTDPKVAGMVVRLLDDGAWPARKRRNTPRASKAAATEAPPVNETAVEAAPETAPGTESPPVTDGAPAMEAPPIAVEATPPRAASVEDAVRTAATVAVVAPPSSSVSVTRTVVVGVGGDTRGGDGAGGSEPDADPPPARPLSRDDGRRGRKRRR
jgi:hypothetical protein